MEKRRRFLPPRRVSRRAAGTWATPPPEPWSWPQRRLRGRSRPGCVS